MKKFLVILSVVAVAGAISTASAMDRTGKIGLGYQETFGAGGNLGTAMGEWSFKYGFTDVLTGQFLLGTTYINKGGLKEVEFGVRVLYSLVKNENSAFYTGAGLLYENIKDQPDQMRFNLPLGFEVSFAGLPEVGFSAEVGLMIDYQKSGKVWSFNTVGGSIGGSLGLGAHYYF
ncbi:MAG: hypothetical protein V1798_01600 [Pseudomonadota bacterium]